MIEFTMHNSFLTDEVVAEFSGFDVLMYYWYMIKTFMSQYSWQVRTSYTIVVLCIFVMIVLMFLFMNLVRNRNRYNKAYRSYSNTYYEAFYDILDSKFEYTDREMLDICDADTKDFHLADKFIMADLLCHVRMQFHDREYLPNLQHLAELLGVRSEIEWRLSKNRDVIKSLQYVCTLPLAINEGLLSLYASSGNKRVRQVARLASLISSSSEPFKYLLEDMNHSNPLIYKISVHRILGWRMAQDMMMAPLLMLAETCTNPDMTSFLIQEVAFWGTAEDQKKLVDFLDDDRQVCRVAAIRAVKYLLIPEAEDILYDSYLAQPQAVRREVVRALTEYHSGKYTEFLADVFNRAPSHTSKMNALECLYRYTPESRDYFEQMYLTCSENDKTLFDEVRTTNNLIG